MKKQFLLITMLLSMTLSACSYKSTGEADADIAETQFTETGSTEVSHEEEVATNVSETAVSEEVEANVSETRISEEAAAESSEDTYAEAPAVGGSDYSFLRKYIDEVYNIHLASEVVGREACQEWVDNVLLKKSAQEQEAIPPIYQIIVDLEISKEDLIKKNNENDGIYLTAETIDALYLEDIEEVKKALMSPLALYHAGEIYVFEELSKNTSKAVDIPTEILDEYFDYIETVCEQEGTIKYMQEEIDNTRMAYGIEVNHREDESLTDNPSLSDYLAQYATDSFEGDYVKLDAVEGLSYVYNENVSGIGEVSYSVSIYNQGIQCGWFGVRQLPKGGLQQEMQLQQFQAELSSHGSVELQGCETIDNVERYRFHISNLPYSYGETEWMVGAGLFADLNEACAESCEDVVVLWSKEGAEKGYYFSANRNLISEDALAQLVEAVSFKYGAFETSNMDKALSASGGVPSFKVEFRDIITYENASRLAYEIVFGEETYHLPEHTFALRVDENKWEIYCYTMDGTGGRLIGSIALSDDGSNKLEVNIMDFGEEW